MIHTDLPPHELYRALEEADRLNLRLDRSRLPHDVVALQRAVRGRTRSDAEARFVLLCRDHGIDLPLVNHRVNGIEADFHWPGRLVVEVDGFEFHRERRQFEEDRRRGLVHNAAGLPVMRVSALQVRDEPALVAEAVAALL